jgi:hypothetical protein
MVFRRPVFATLTVPPTGISCERENIEGDSILKQKKSAYCRGMQYAHINIGRLSREEAIE